MNLFKFKKTLMNAKESYDLTQKSRQKFSPRIVAKNSAIEEFTTEANNTIKTNCLKGQYSCKVSIKKLHNKLYPKYDISLIDEAIRDIKNNFKNIGYYVSGDREDFSLYFEWKQPK